MNPRPAMSALDQKRTFCDPLNPPAKMDIGRHAFGTAFLLLPVTRCMMLHAIRSSSRGNWNDLSKETLYGLGLHKFGVTGYNMAPRDQYLLRAAELNAMAQGENHADKLEFDSACLSALSQQAERNSQTTIVYETPPKKKHDRA